MIVDLFDLGHLLPVFDVLFFELAQLRRSNAHYLLDLVALLPLEPPFFELFHLLLQVLRVLRLLSLGSLFLQFVVPPVDLHLELSLKLLLLRQRLFVDLYLFHLGS